MSMAQKRLALSSFPYISIKYSKSLFSSFSVMKYHWGIRKTSLTIKVLSSNFLKLLLFQTPVKHSTFVRYSHCIYPVHYNTIKFQKVSKLLKKNCHDDRSNEDFL